MNNKSTSTPAAYKPLPERDAASTQPALTTAAMQLALLLTITLLAAALRFHNLDTWSFWGDEILSVAAIPDGFNFNIIRQSLALTLIGWTIDWLGVSEWSARLVPALIGILSIPILYFPIRRAAGVPVALLSVLLLALAPWHLYWSQNARFYTLLLLFYTLALLFFFIALEEDRPSYFILSFLFLGLAARERLLALFLVPVLGAFLILVLLLPFNKPAGLRRLRRLSLLLIPGLLLAAYFAWPYVRQLPDWLAGFSRINNSPIWLAAGVAYYVRLSVICVALGGVVYYVAQVWTARKMNENRQRGGDQRHRLALLLIINALLPLLGLMALSTFHYTANRYVFITLPAWLILAALAIVELFRHANANQPASRWLAAGALLFVLLDPLGENLLYYQFQNGNRDDWRAAFALVDDLSTPEDRIVSPHQQLADYYLARDTVPATHIDLSIVRRSERAFWFIEDLTVAELRPDLYHWLRHEAELVGVFDVTVQARTFIMRVYRYPPRAAPPP